MKTMVAQRAGIVASVVWFFVGFSWTWLDETKQAADFASMLPKMCEEKRWAQDPPPPDHCWETYEKDFKVMAPNRWADGLIVGLLPIPLAWLIAFGVVRTTRWTLYGRWRRLPPENLDS